MNRLNLLSARISPRPFLCAAILAAFLAVVAEGKAQVVTFSAGSLIVPMDIDANGQDVGMLRAYGLVYQLLRNNVSVYWAINPAKIMNGDADFTINSGSLQNFRTGASISTPRTYRGGPFVIAASDAAAALPIISAWQVASGDDTMVHGLISGSFTANVARMLIRAPRIGILMDGNETIAFNNLNAAGIPDSTGAFWGPSSPDLLTEAAVKGPTTDDHADGVLFHTPDGLARYGYFASMHYNTTADTPEVVSEVRSWLRGPANFFTDAFMQCEAARTFENDPAGHFLTTLGLVNDGATPLSPLVRGASWPVAQIDGTLQADSGAVDSIGLAPGSQFKTLAATLINDATASLLARIVLLTGRMDGDAGNGVVTYLAGHDYSIDLPISSNPQTNGVRLFLNSIFDSGAAVFANQDDVTLAKSGPALINTSTIPYTINYMNPGPRPVENLKLIDRLPAGTTYLAGSGVPAPTSISGDELTWNLPPLASGASATVTFSVSVTTDGSYANTAQMEFSNVAVRTVSSNTVTTIRDSATPTPSYSAQVQQPINANGTSVFNVSRGVVPVKFTLTQDGVATCALPPATIAVYRTGTGGNQQIDESTYSGPADTGSNFRIDSCQYVYNLSASALGVSIYRVDILINGQVVGSGVFQLK
jgi:uncharacterized repeat protein (TIGR01451 family)